MHERCIDCSSKQGATVLGFTNVDCFIWGGEYNKETKKKRAAPEMQMKSIAMTWMRDSAREVGHDSVQNKCARWVWPGVSTSNPNGC